MGDDLGYVKSTIEENWHESIDGRIQDVPKPKVYQESDPNRRRVKLNEGDVIFVKDGGTTHTEPQSFNWVEERVDSRIDIDIRSTGDGGNINGRTRMWGVRDDDGNSERYGGLVGEVKRIFHERRRGEAGYDVISLPEIHDLSGEMGARVWRTSIFVSLSIRAQTIDPSPTLDGN
jgi:hypothetical protein